MGEPLKYRDLAEIDNFRDLGGFRTRDGRRVRDGMIFRSGMLPRGMSPAAAARLDSLGIRTVFDLRCDDEAEMRPDYVPSGCDYCRVPMFGSEKLMAVKPEDFSRMLREDPVRTRREGLDCMREIYRVLPFGDAACGEVFRAMDRGERFLFHCSAGKDRTGMIAALILHALGCADSVLFEDYMLSNVYRRQINDQMYAAMEEELGDPRASDAMRVGIETRETLLEASLREIERRYGTMDNYLLERFGAGTVRVGRWRAAYTLPPD